MFRKMHMNKFLLQAEDCAVMVIDIQEKLFAVMDERFRSLLIRNSRILVETAQALDMPIVVTEQYPKGMGGTILEIGEHIRGIQRYEKLYFSCYRDPAIRDRTDSLARKTVIVAGMETHVCVFQTVIDLLMAGYRVVIAGDAVSSRRELDRKEAIIEMRSAGALIYSTEMIAFMLLEKAGTTQFKRLAPFFK
jgi:nicotinamidase-related amidase